MNKNWNTFKCTFTANLVALQILAEPPDRFLSRQLLFGCAGDFSVWQFRVENLLRFDCRVTVFMRLSTELKVGQFIQLNSHVHVVIMYSCLTTLLFCITMCSVWTTRILASHVFYMYLYVLILYNLTFNIVKSSKCDKRQPMVYHFEDY